MIRLLTCLALLLSAAPAWSAPAIWRLQDADTTITLFGSVHALPADAVWRTPELDRAISQADEVWFEFPSPNAPGMREAYARAYAARPKQAAPTSKLLSPEGLRLAVQAFGSQAAVDGQPASVLVQELTRRAWVKAGVDGRFGVESRIQAMAPPHKQRSFGDPQQHLALAASGTARQNADLLERLLRTPVNPEPQKRATEAWLRGDMAALQSDVLERLRASDPRLARAFVDERNRKWTQPVAAMLNRPGRFLVVVGAAHMAGPDGLPALLRARGLKVEGP